MLSFKKLFSKKPDTDSAKPLWEARPARSERSEILLRNDFGVNLRFSLYGEISRPEEYYKSLSIELGEELMPEGLPKKSSLSCHACTLDGHRALRLHVDVPTFDSSDRQYDSWHFLLLFKGAKPGTVSGLYSRGGYQVADVLLCKTLTEAPEEIYKLLRQAKVI